MFLFALADWDGVRKKKCLLTENDHILAVLRESHHMARGAGNNLQFTQSSTKQFCGFKSQPVELLKLYLPVYSFLI